MSLVCHIVPKCSPSTAGKRKISLSTLWTTFKTNFNGSRKPCKDNNGHLRSTLENQTYFLENQILHSPEYQEKSLVWPDHLLKEVSPRWSRMCLEPPRRLFSLMPDFKVRNKLRKVTFSPVSTHCVIFPPNFAFVWGFPHVLFI